jgi:hypothetical protein
VLRRFGRVDEDEDVLPVKERRGNRLTNAQRSHSGSLSVHLIDVCHSLG